MASDLTLKPDFPIETEPAYKTLISEFEDGTEQRRQKRGQKIKEWRLVYKNRGPSDLAIITALFDSKKGAYGSFTWDNPEDGETYTVRFKDDKLRYEYVTCGLYNFEFNLVQVL